MTIADLTPSLRSEFAVADGVVGVIVTKVAAGSPAATAEIEPGDVIVQSSQHDVSSAAQVAEDVNSVRQSGRDGVVFYLALRASPEHRFVNVEFAK